MNSSHKENSMKIFNKPTVPTLDALKPSQLVSGELSREDWRKRMLEGYKGILLGNPIQYRGFGPFWWILKKEMLDAGIADFGDSLDAEWVERDGVVPESASHRESRR